MPPQAQPNPGTVIGKWTGGVNSLLPPDSIGITQYAWGINIVNRGGIVQTRPGYDFAAYLKGKKAQGATIFTPTNSRPVMLVAVDGEIWMAKLPFKVFVKLDGLKFRSDAPIITFCLALKSANVKADQSIELVSPKALVFIQDGSTKCGSFDGDTAKHLDHDLGGPPVGLWMFFASSVLWVCSGSRVYASDLASPDTFFATAYIAERSAFEIGAEITGIIQTSDEKALLIFTETTTTSLQANIRDRKQWAQTPNFQQVILPTIGCVSGRSPVNQYGLTWWMSHAGFINLDAAMQSKLTSKLVTVDGAMMRSKRILSPNLTGVASTYFENFLLVSVPSGGRYNEETWLADQAPGGEAGGGVSTTWVGVWTGARPVQWMRTSFGGRERLFFLAYDETPVEGSRIHVWEAFKSDRRDNDARIACQFETGMMMGSDLTRFNYAEIDTVEILGNVELSIFVGGFRGQWYKVKDTTLQAEMGCFGSVALPLIEASSILESYKPQSRVVKTEEFSSQGRGCSGPESEHTPGYDKGFQLLLEWRGRMGVKAIKFVCQPDPSPTRGECRTGELGAHNIVTEEGASITVGE